MQGAVIAGKYRLQRVIGKGSMGDVWAATNELTRRDVAIKLIPSPSPDLRARLVREARACGRLSHRNIVEVYDAGESENGTPYLVMPLLAGETLAERLYREGRLAPAVAVGIAVDIARALRAAHAATIVHRDLKPANVFLHVEAGAEGEQVKVLDFGVSKVLRGEDAAKTLTGTVLGSPAYMSPEQARADKTLDHRADLWSLGVILFEMLTGVRPFPCKTAQGVIAEIVAGPIPAVTSLAPEVDERLAAVVARCLERDRGKRVQSAEEVIELLRPLSPGVGRVASGNEWRVPGAAMPAGGEEGVGGEEPAVEVEVDETVATVALPPKPKASAPGNAGRVQSGAAVASSSEQAQAPLAQAPAGRVAPARMGSSPAAEDDEDAEAMVRLVLKRRRRTLLIVGVSSAVAILTLLIVAVGVGQQMASENQERRGAVGSSATP